jgi:hypothetical protein
MGSEVFIAISAVVISILSFIATYFGFIIRITERLARIETKTNLFWGMVEEKLAGSLKQPTHKVKDDLLDKLTVKEINGEEIDELLDILRDECTLDERKNLLLNYHLVISHLEVMKHENFLKSKIK